jgi:hypothetical protein
VRDHDGLHAQRVLFKNVQNTLDLVARVDNYCFARLIIAENGTVALQHADRQDLMNHNGIMDPTVRAVLAVSIRWIHIASVVTLLGGFIYARFALAPALATLPEGEAMVSNATEPTTRMLMIKTIFPR